MSHNSAPPIKGGHVWVDGRWRDSNDPVLSANASGLWLASSVFDGARAFDGTALDLDRHCRRINRSAKSLGLVPTMRWEEVHDLAVEGIRKFPSGSHLYIKPVYWADDGFIAPLPETTRFAISVLEAPLPPATGFTAHLSKRRRPGPEMAPTAAKASCLYPQSGLALFEARAAGFDNAVMLDPMGAVAEFTSSNIFVVKDGKVITPIPNGCLLNGITRQRVITLFREQGIEVVERRIDPGELESCDEMFSTANFSKITPVTRYENRELGIGPMAQKARELYMDCAHRLAKL